MPSPNDIRRKVELTLCALLRESVPGLVALPSRGGDDATPAGDILPPYVELAVRDANRPLPGEPVWSCTGEATYVTHIDDKDDAARSQVVSAIIAALECIEPGYYPPQAIRLHGLEVTATDDVSSASQQAHGDVISFAAGVTG